MLANTTRALTEAQREQWAVDGYLQLEGALSPAEVDFFSGLLDKVRGQPGYEPAATELQRGHYAWKLPDQNLDAFMDRRDLLPYHQAFIDLIDRPRIFDLILDLMGPFIQFSMSQAIIRASTDTFPGYIHTDGGEAQKAIRVSETSRPLAVKVMYLLTDVTAPDSGNVLFYPEGSVQPLYMPSDALAIKAQLGVVTQFDTLDPDFTCAENLRVFGRYFGLKGGEEDFVSC